MRTLTFRLVLCILLALEAVAAPITYQQVTQKPITPPATTNPQSNPPSAQITVPDSSDRPEFVRLTDGRIVPFGSGVICSDECVPSEAFAPDDPADLRAPGTGIPRWVWFLPAVAVLPLFRRGDDPGTIITPSDPPRIIDPPIPAEVPEPATLMLLGLGLAMMARHGFGKKKSDDD